VVPQPMTQQQQEQRQQWQEKQDASSDPGVGARHDSQFATGVAASAADREHSTEAAARGAAMAQQAAGRRHQPPPLHPCCLTRGSLPAVAPVGVSRKPLKLSQVNTLHTRQPLHASTSLERISCVLCPWPTQCMC